MRLPNPRRAVRIARTDIRIAWRSFRDSGRLQQGLLVGVAGFGLLVLAAVVFVALAAGGDVADGDIATPLETAALVPAGLFSGAVAFTVYMTAVQYAETDNRDGLLTTVPHADLAGGLLLSTFVRVWSYLAVPLLVAAVAFGVGAGSPLTAVLTVVGVLLVVAPGYVLGFALGVLLKHLFGQSETVVRYRAVLGVVVFLAYIGLFVTESVSLVVDPVVAATAASPVAWFADLALLALVDGASPVRAAAAAGGGLAVLGLSIAATVKATGTLWYSDPVQTGRGEETSSDAGRLAVLVGRPAAWVAKKSWLRARRAPLKLIYVAYPLFFLIGPIQTSVTTGTVSVTLPALAAVYGAWSTGAAFGLNPLGDEGAVLPITATSGVRGRTVVRGLLAASLVPGLPATVLLTGVLAALSPMSTLAAALMALGAGVLCVAAAGLAVGIGAALPRYDAASITRSRKVVVPSTWAFVVYSLAVSLLAAPATLAQLPGVADWAGGLTGLGTAGVQVLGLGVALVLVGAVAVLGTRYGARRFDEYVVA